jgi:Tol biopolymer transport system component
VIALIAVGLMALIAAASAHATFPGSNGRIAFGQHGVFPGSDDFDNFNPPLHSQVFAVGASGSDLVQLTHVTSAQSAGAPSWSPNGQQIAYESNESGAFGIWVTDANGSSQMKLTSKPGFEDFLPSWSPDGKRILFSRCGEPFGFVAYCDIDSMNANGTDVETLASAGHWENVGAEYSPNGRRIVFSGDRGGFKSSVWVMRASGASIKRLTAPRLQAFWPDWSPNGRRILFTSHFASTGASNVWSMRANGTRRQKLTHFALPLQAYFASYSPNGKRIVLGHSRRCPHSITCRDFYVMHSDGSHLRRTGVDVLDPLLADWGPRS